ncbi:MAG: hypothetical protein ACRBN8_13625 [Nannocystales bacterium]
MFVGFQTLVSSLLAIVAPSPEGLSLRWDAPEGCPNADDVSDAFQRQAEDERSPVEAQGTVTHSPGGYRLELHVSGAGGRESRTIESNSCASLGETAGLLLAVAADPAQATEPLIPEPEPEPEPAPELEPEPEALPEPEPRTSHGPPARVEPVTDARPETQRQRPVQLVVRADGVVQMLRLLPEIVGGGPSGALAISADGWRTELRGTYVAPQPRRYPDDGSVGGTFDLWTAGAVGCWVPRQRRLSFPLCAGAELGSLRGRADGVESPGSGRSLFAAATADASVVFAPIPRLALRAGAGGAISLRRPLFHVRGLTTLFEAGPGALRVALGVEVRFF